MTPSGDGSMHVMHIVHVMYWNSDVNAFHHSNRGGFRNLPWDALCPLSSYLAVCKGHRIPILFVLVV
jgi:hypothetical protein